MSSPDRPSPSSFDSKITRGNFLKLAGITIAGMFAGALSRPKESIEATSPPTVIYWTDSLGRSRRTSFINASSGIYPYNNPDRPVATIYDWIDISVPSGTNYTLEYQPWEGLYPETQAGPGVSLGIRGLLVDPTTNKEYMLTTVRVSQDGESITLSVETVQDANNPTDYSSTGRKRTKDALSQPGIHVGGLRITSFQFGTDALNNQRYIEISYYNEYVAAEKGTERIYPDNNGNLIPPFFKVASAEPTSTPTTVPPTITPSHTPTPAFRPRIYLPNMMKNSAGR